MTAVIRGPYRLVSQIRDYVQGSQEPYLYGTCDGFVVGGLEDDQGAGESVLLLSETEMPKKDLETTRMHRTSFVEKLKKRYPVLDINYYIP